jgi:hypothetical protein
MKGKAFGHFYQSAVQAPVATIHMWDTFLLISIEAHVRKQIYEICDDVLAQFSKMVCSRRYVANFWLGSLAAVHIVKNIGSL